MPLPDLSAHSVLALDLETTGLDPRTDTITVIAVTDGDDVWIIQPHQEDPVALRDWVRDLCHTTCLIGHNLAFDYSFLLDTWQVNPRMRTWDTMVADQLINAKKDVSHSLKSVLERYFGIEIDKSLQTSFDGSDLTPEQISYIENDVRYLFRIAKMQQQELARLQLGPVWELERTVLPLFTQMQLQGVHISRERLQLLIDENEVELEQLRTHLQERLTPEIYWMRIAKFDEQTETLNLYLEEVQQEERRLQRQWTDGIDSATLRVGPGTSGWDKRWLDEATYDDGRIKGQARYVADHLKEWRKEHPRPKKPDLDTSLINLDSPQQVKAALNHLGIVIETTKRKALQAILPAVSEQLQRDVLNPLLTYKRLAKLNQSFGETLMEMIDHQGKVYPSYRQIGTATGRPSASKPNTLQVPKHASNYRHIFIPGEGNVFVIADYSQQELRVIADISGDATLIPAFIEGRDLHMVTAAGIFHDGDESRVTDEERSIGKLLNFASLYGVGPQGIRVQLAAEGIRVSEVEAERMLDGWRSTYRQAAQQIAHWGNEALRYGYTSTILGRRRFFDPPSNRGEEGAVRRQGANHPIQGTAADMTKLAMLVIDRLAGDLGHIVLNVYDEIVFECPEEHAEEAARIVKTGMISAAESILTSTPVAVDVSISRSWDEHDDLRADDKRYALSDWTAIPRPADDALVSVSP